MKRIILLIIISFNSILYAKVNIVVSIEPQYMFVKMIGKDKVNITTIVKRGNSPHTYEPKPSQMKAISKANIYFTIGVEFENSWLPRFINQNKNMSICDSSKHIKKISIDNSKHKKHLDPHIWTTPSNIKIIAKNILEALVKIDKKNKNYYKQNYDKFIIKINNTDKKIKENLKNIPPQTKFMVFHPSWGYFAKEYNLQQFPIEISGKNPKLKELIHIIKQAKQNKIDTIFTSSDFSTKASTIIAKELNIKVFKISSLSSNSLETIIKLSKTIGKK
jgi:zinc transport system substrate-binding protein